MLWVSGRVEWVDSDAPAGTGITVKNPNMGTMDQDRLWAVDARPADTFQYNIFRNTYADSELRDQKIARIRPGQVYNRWVRM
ncbi:MAG: hypothetical protein ABIF71_04710 [Planctomycetota bacterium]